MDQLAQSGQSAAINLAHVGAAEQGQQPGETQTRPHVGFVDVDGDRVGPSELPRVSGQDACTLPPTRTLQSGITVCRSLPEVREAVPDNLKRKSPEVQCCQMVPRATPNTDQGVGVSVPRETETSRQRETAGCRGGWTDASEVCVVELQSDPGSFSSSAECATSPASSVDEYRCTECDATFSRPDQLADHSKTHAPKNAKRGRKSGVVGRRGKRYPVYKDETPYACDGCPKKFARNCDLTIHRRCHSGEKPFACDSCEARFTRSSHLTVHKRSHSGERPFVCRACAATFARNCDLTMHARCHSGVKPYACDVCGSRFTRSFHLTTHARTHSGERPHACGLCSARFTTSSNLTSHARCHSGEKPYPCALCGARFTRSCDLSRHNKSHLKDRVFACDMCATSFATSCDLSRHKRSHAGEKPYACALCQARFCQSSSLTKHKRTHLGDKS